MRFYAVAQGPYTRYQDLVRLTLEKAMQLHGARYEEAFGDELVEEAKKFPVFPEVPQALRELKDKGVQLCIISNSDRDFIKYHVETIGVDFDYVLTAEDAGWYKPNEGAFEYMFKTIDRDPSLVTHVAQGWDYDIIPAKKYGIRRIWVNRYALKGSDFYQPYFEIPDLAPLPTYWEATA